MDFQYEGFGLGQRVKNATNNWIPLNPDVYLINKPTVLMIGGSGTEGVRSANGNAKIIQSLLDSTGTNAELLSVYYNGKTPTPGMFEYYTRRFTRDLFTPLLCMGRQKLDTETACKNMRNLTIFAHSLGGKTVENILDEMSVIMKRANYTDEEVNKVLKQIFVVSYGVTLVSPKIYYLSVISPADEQFANSGETCWKVLIKKIMRYKMMTPAERQNLPPEAVVNMPEKDMAALSKISFLLDSPKLIREFYNTNEKCYVMQEGDNELQLVTSPLRASHKDHAITHFARTSDGQQNVYATKTGDCVSKCMAAALKYSVDNSAQNAETKELVPFDIAQLRTILEQTALPLNSQHLTTPRELQ